MLRTVTERGADALAALYHRTRRTPVIGPAMVRAIEARTGNRGWIETRVRAGPLRGMTLHIDPRVQADVILGAYERRLSRHVASLLGAGETAFDVGSHLGYFGILMATVVGASGSVVCFEPDPRLVGALEENVERNRSLMPAKVTIARLAVGATGGTTSFSTGGHSTRGRLSEDGDVEVEVSTLDGVVARFGSPRFVKVDVEGGELDVLEGAPELLAARTTSFGIEIHSAALGESCRRLLEAEGYRCDVIREGGRSETFLLADPPP